MCSLIMLLFIIIVAIIMFRQMVKSFINFNNGYPVGDF